MEKLLRRTETAPRLREVELCGMVSFVSESVVVVVVVVEVSFSSDKLISFQTSQELR
jgi:hypothetical protein